MSESELNVKKRTLKLHVFDEFDFTELSEIVESIKLRGYTAKMVSNGNIVLVRNEE